MEVHLNSHLPDFCKAALKAWMQQPQRWKLEVFRRWFVIASFAKSFWSSEPSHVDHLLWLSEGVKALRICWQPKARRRVFVVSFCHGTLTVREFCLHTQKLFGTAVCVEFIWIFKPIHRRVWRFRLRCTNVLLQYTIWSGELRNERTKYSILPQPNAIRVAGASRFNINVPLRVDLSVNVQIFCSANWVCGAGFFRRQGNTVLVKILMCTKSH